MISSYMTNYTPVVFYLANDAVLVDEVGHGLDDGGLSVQPGLPVDQPK